MKRFLLGLLALGIVLLPMGAMAEMGTGKVIAKSSDINIEMFGSLKTYPHFMDNVDFNSDDTKYDYIGDENGAMSEHSIRNELRVGWQGGNDNWDFLVILEADFVLNKYYGDRGDDTTNFGVEKVNFGYNFDDFKLNTGWNTKFLDINSGGVLYGDDHPYIGLSGKSGSMNWEALYLIIQDDIYADEDGILDGETLDWRAYTLRAGFDMNGFTLAPMYAFSDNSDHEAEVHYLGVEGYGKVGDFTPRFEVVWATGDQDVGAQERDVDAWAAYASVDFNFSDAFTPYIGGYYMTGDSDANDDDIEAFNGITNIARYTPTFGMENAFIYRTIPALGTVLYSNAPNMLGTSKDNPQPGYGGVGNTCSRNAPGLIMGGLGAKGTMDKFSYKAQFMYFAFEEEGAIEDYYGVDIDDELGMEFDLQLTYKFGKHFSIGNVLAIFDPGDAVKDILGDDYDETAILDTVELTWTF